MFVKIAAFRAIRFESDAVRFLRKSVAQLRVMAARALLALQQKTLVPSFSCHLRKGARACMMEK
jgi:hypothetical protein